MKNGQLFKVKRSEVVHDFSTVTQTGFPSPATHYLEPKIDLNKELTINADATFFIRVQGDGYARYKIRHQDVLLVDRGINPHQGNLLIVEDAGEFLIEVYENIKEACTVWGVVTYIIHKTA